MHDLQQKTKKKQKQKQTRRDASVFVNKKCGRFNVLLPCLLSKMKKRANVFINNKMK